MPVPKTEKFVKEWTDNVPIKKRKFIRSSSSSPCGSNPDFNGISVLADACCISLNKTDIQNPMLHNFNAESDTAASTKPPDQFPWDLNRSVEFREQDNDSRLTFTSNASLEHCGLAQQKLHEGPLQEGKTLSSSYLHASSGLSSSEPCGDRSDCADKGVANMVAVEDVGEYVSEIFPDSGSHHEDGEVWGSNPSSREGGESDSLEENAESLMPRDMACHTETQDIEANGNTVTDYGLDIEANNNAENGMATNTDESCAQIRGSEEFQKGKGSQSQAQKSQDVSYGQESDVDDPNFPESECARSGSFSTRDPCDTDGKMSRKDLLNRPLACYHASKVGPSAREKHTSRVASARAVPKAGQRNSPCQIQRREPEFDTRSPSRDRGLSVRRGGSAFPFDRCYPRCSPSSRTRSPPPKYRAPYYGSRDSSPNLAVNPRLVRRDSLPRHARFESKPPIRTHKASPHDPKWDVHGEEIRYPRSPFSGQSPKHVYLKWDRFGHALRFPGPERAERFTETDEFERSRKIRAEAWQTRRVGPIRSERDTRTYSSKNWRRLERRENQLVQQRSGHRCLEYESRDAFPSSDPLKTPFPKKYRGHYPWNQKRPVCRKGSMEPVKHCCRPMRRVYDDNPGVDPFGSGFRGPACRVGNRSWLT